MECIYCAKIAKSLNSKVQHEIRCNLNPNKINVVPSFGMLGKKGANQYKYGASMSDNTKKKISAASKKQIWNVNRRARHSEVMKKAVEKFPDSYTSSNRGRTKQIFYDGIKFQGRWELEFYQYCKNNNIIIERSNEYFEYEWNGTRKYFPDFYLPESETYVEVKGYETDRDKAKWNQFPKKLLIIKKNEINAIRKGSFVRP